MTSWLKALVLLALVVPMTAYVAGSIATSRAHDPADRTPLIIQDRSVDPQPTQPPSPTPTRDTTRTPAPTPAPTNPTGATTRPTRDVDDDEVRVVTPLPTPVGEDVADDHDDGPDDDGDDGDDDEDGDSGDDGDDD